MLLQEFFDGGLVTARDPSLLRPGELQQTDNLIYRPASPSPEQAPGHLLMSNAAGSDINGMVHCAFDNGLSLLLIQAGNLYKSTPANNPTLLTDLSAVGGGSALDSVHYNNRHYLFNGVGPNQVLLNDGTLRRHGLVAISIGPAISVTASGGTWPLLDDSLPAYYEYWTTEVYKSATEEIESTFVGTPTTVYVASSATYVTVYRPLPINPQATHWRVYRSIRKKNFADKSFPTGFVAADLPIATTSFSDGLTTTTTLRAATTAVSNTGTSPLGNIIAPNYYRHIGPAWTSPTNALLDDGLRAVSPPLIVTGTSTLTSEEGELILGSFGFTNIGSPVTNIQVQVKGKLNEAHARATIYLSWDGGIHYTTGKSAGLAVGSVTTAVIDGGDWGHVWSGATDFGNGAFQLLVRAQTFPGGPSTTLEIDYVSVAVTHSGATGATIIPFPVTSIIVGGAEFQDGANGEPVTASFGAIFQDSLVTNDINNKGIIRYSLETLPDAQPPEYFLPLVTEKHDEITALRTIGSVLIAGLNTYVARIDFLPRAEDAEFSRGRAWDIVQGSHGIVGKKAAVSFFIPQQGLYLAHVSRHGLMMTNGYQADTLTDDLDFLALVNPDRLKFAEFVNHPAEYRLLLFYTPVGGLSNTKVLVFYYHPLHLKNGKLKVSGPLDVVSTGTAVALLPTGEERLYTTSNQQIYLEGSGPETPFVLKSREIYPGGPGISGEVTKVLLHQNGGGTYKVTPTIIAENVEPRDEQPNSIVAPSHGMARVPFRSACDGVAFKIERTGGSGGSVDYIMIDHTGFGPENYPA